MCVRACVCRIINQSVSICPSGIRFNYEIDVISSLCFSSEPFTSDPGEGLGYVVSESISQSWYDPHFSQDTPRTRPDPRWRGEVIEMTGESIALVPVK